MAEIIHNNNDLGAGIIELMLELTRGIQRIGIYHGKSRTQDGEDGDWILQQVGHHDRDPVTFLHARNILQICRKLVGQAIQVGVAERCPHIGECG
jgi:hypothetical protein